MSQPEATPGKAGFSISEWCPLAGVSRATFYAMPATSKPEHLYVGTRLVIKEAPADWLARMALAGGVKIPKRKAKPTPEHAAA